jgi:hypothetical protein
MSDVFDSSTRLKTDVMFHGLRFSAALGDAATHSYPNFYPYKFRDDEPNPTGRSKVPIPYLAKTDDGTLFRVQGDGQSKWSVSGDRAAGYRLQHDDRDDDGVALQFEPLPEWMSRETSDGFPMAHAGIGLHGDMAVVNVAPGCEFFLHKHDGESMRCKFCAYGAPDERTAHLGQAAGKVAIPGQTLARMQETLKAAIDAGGIRHIYLVGGSLPDGEAEAERFMQVAAAVHAINDTDIPVSLGSGALPDAALERFHNAGLVDHVCFNLEVWSEPLFAAVCPGKHRYVGYEHWIASLEKAVRLWGRGNVYSAMVAGIELEPDYGMSADAAAQLAVRGAEDLCARGIIPIYSLFWPVGQAHHPDYRDPLRNYFETLNADCHEIRRKHDLRISDGFMCHRCAYMQLECDTDRASANRERGSA